MNYTRRVFYTLVCLIFALGSMSASTNRIGVDGFSPLNFGLVKVYVQGSNLSKSVGCLDIYTINPRSSNILDSQILLKKVYYDNVIPPSGPVATYAVPLDGRSYIHIVSCAANHQAGLYGKFARYNADKRTQPVLELVYQGRSGDESNESRYYFTQVATEGAPDEASNIMQPHQSLDAAQGFFVIADYDPESKIWNKLTTYQP